MADNRSKELDALKYQRREECVSYVMRTSWLTTRQLRIKRRLEDAGWVEPDWKFHVLVVRKWVALVEGPKPLTDRSRCPPSPSLCSLNPFDA
jgi:hypothetical protein